MHHGQDGPVNEELLKQLQRFQREANDLGLGPTGRFPEGKLDETDEGEIQISAGIHNGKVVLNFGKEISWIGFSPAQAEQIGDLLKDAATRAGKKLFVNQNNNGGQNGTSKI